MTRQEFLARFGPVFENRPDLAEAVWAARPDLSSAEAPHRGFVAVPRGLPPAAQRAFLDDHPDLAGRLLEAGQVTAASVREQGSAGLDALDGTARARLLALNEAYRARFGFSLVMAVRDRRPKEILAAFESRLGRGAAEEQEEALRQVERILLLRLRDRFAAG